MDSDSTEEWAWTFKIGDQSVCLTGNSGDSLPWQSAVSQSIDFSSSKAQIRLNIDAWEKDAPGPLCTWEHADSARQRILGNVDLNLASLTFDETPVSWTKTLDFIDRSYLSGDQKCSTTVGGQIRKRDTNYMVPLFLAFLASLEATSASEHLK
jgi:hypothetical protein